MAVPTDPGNGNGWGFYGRREEFSRLCRLLSVKHYRTLAVLGGRGVGKTELIRRACDAVGELKPAVYVEVPVPASESHEDRMWAVGRVCRDLARQAEELGLGDALSEAERFPFDLLYFDRAFKGLLGAGAVVVLDEYQNGDKIGLTGSVKPVIDSFRYIGAPATAGKTVLAGSHQQEMIRILEDQRLPLYGRVDHYMRLGPLPAPAVLRMASEQGWLSRPKRFLTAYTVFGGNPRLWRRMSEENAEEPLPEPPDGDDDAWRMGFLEREISRMRGDPRERFDFRSLVTLDSDARKAAELVARHFRGVREEKVRGLFTGKNREDAEGRCISALNTLKWHLHMVEQTPSAKPYGPSKIRMKDTQTLFQLRVASLWPEAGVGGSAAGKAMGAMANAEGYALERLAGEWLVGFRTFSEMEIGMVRKGPDGKTVETDVVAVTHDKDGVVQELALCSCKRDPGRHDLKRTAGDFRRFVEYSEAHGMPVPVRPRWLLVSPERPAASGDFRAYGLKDMARKLKLEIRPWPGLPAPGPEIEFDDGPSPGL
ncbi:MAG: ATP-binding protein [Rhodobacteraceae bacterium]|nr:ATP-binding protein [Paracoccaceae bacterium]MCY3877589.1 ATP-binding protein [Paracoccaceae bacterium]